MDSIAGSIGAAELFGGFASRASEVNSETRFCLDYWDVKVPEPIENMLSAYPEAGVCLVDHQQTSQLNSSIPVDRIVGVIDHHALQNRTFMKQDAVVWMSRGERPQSYMEETVSWLPATDTTT